MHNSSSNRNMTQNQAPARAFQPVPYTQEEYEDIQDMLNKFLGPEYVSTRPGAGNQRVSYIEGWKALNLANEIFGFNGWSSEMINTTVDFIDTHGNSGKIAMGLSIVVRITIKDGTYHEDIGYGFIENAKNKAAAFEKCKKEAFTDGLKRCLRCFGNVLGNCLYDKKLLSKLQKVEKKEAELDDGNLYRDATFLERQQKRKANTAAIKTASRAPTASANGSRSYHSKSNENKTKAYVTPAKTNETIDGFDDSYLFSDDIDNDFSQNDGIDEYDMQMILDKTNDKSIEKVPNADPTPEPLRPPNIPAESSFVSARKADLVQGGMPPTTLPQFNAKFISPSIRRTVDPTRSVPIKRTEAGTSQTPSKAPTISNIPLNPAGKRLICMPPSQQRPPIKRLHKDIQPDEAIQDKENRNESQT